MCLIEIDYQDVVGFVKLKIQTKQHGNRKEQYARKVYK